MNIANRQLEKVNERKKTKNTGIIFFLKKIQLSNLHEKKKMAVKNFEFLEQFMIEKFSIKITQFEKTGSIDKNLVPLRNLQIPSNSNSMMQSNLTLGPFFQAH